ncbi:MAG: hypothetical protein ABW221_03010 [Vicinamibacteria bacterium]
MTRVGTVAGILWALLAAGPAHAQKTSAELTDPPGDVNEANNGPENARDVVKLSLGSDGTSLTVAATLAKDERSTMAGGVVRFYVDRDRNAATGGKTRYGQAGFELEGELSVCHGDGAAITSCAGGGDGKPPRARYARVGLEEFTGKRGEPIQKYTTTRTVSSGMDSASGPPLVGRVVTAAIPYADLGVKAGQVVRVLALEVDANDDGAFPEVLLTLK